MAGCDHNAVRQAIPDAASAPPGAVLEHVLAALRQTEAKTIGLDCMEKPLENSRSENIEAFWSQLRVRRTNETIECGALVSALGALRARPLNHPRRDLVRSIGVYPASPPMPLSRAEAFF